jgi:hypothetical protein
MSSTSRTTISIERKIILLIDYLSSAGYNYSSDVMKRIKSAYTVWEQLHLFDTRSIERQRV